MSHAVSAVITEGFTPRLHAGPADMVEPPAVPGQVAIVPTGDPATRLRVSLDPTGGEMLLEQLAYNATLGWYRQRLMRLPAASLHQLGSAVRLADCLSGRQPAESPRTASTLRLRDVAEDAA